MKTELRRTCPSCGNEFSGAMEFCPVCLLRKALAEAVESGESSAFEDVVKLTTSHRPLVREYFGEQLQSQRTEAWKECNRRLYEYYRTLAPHLPNSFSEMEPLFLSVICGCNAGLFREALHEVYISRIQRGDGYFAANVLGARGALLLVLVLGRTVDPEFGRETESTVTG
jgi:hypothetical protein